MSEQQKVREKLEHDLMCAADALMEYTGAGSYCLPYKEGQIGINVEPLRYPPQA